MAFIEAVAAVVIQTAFRRHLARQFVLYLRQIEMENHLSQEHSEEPESRASRRHPQQEEEEEYDVMRLYTAAATIIQATFRGFWARECLNEMEWENHLLQEQSEEPVSRVSQRNTQQEEEEEYDVMRLYTGAATIIQANFRGFWARDCLNVDFYCATAIQRIFRGYICRMNYHYDRYRIVTVQSIWRKCIDRERVAYLLAYAILIQSAVRGFFVRRAVRNMKFKLSYARANGAATVIQSVWRMHFCWMWYNKLLCVLIIQSVLRGWLARKMAASLRAAGDAESRKQHHRGGENGYNHAGVQSAEWRGDRFSSSSGATTMTADKAGRRQMALSTVHSRLRARQPFHQNQVVSDQTTTTAAERFPHSNVEGNGYGNKSVVHRGPVRNNYDAERHHDVNVRDKTTTSLRSQEFMSRRPERRDVHGTVSYENVMSRRLDMVSSSQSAQANDSIPSQSPPWDCGVEHDLRGTNRTPGRRTQSLSRSEPRSDDQAVHIPLDISDSANVMERLTPSSLGQEEARTVVVDKSGDEYEWAYELWSRKGLLPWKPNSG